MSLMLEIKPAEGPVSRTSLQPGRNRFSVRLGDTFRIYDDQTGLTPKGISVKRVDSSLIVDGMAAAGKALVIEFAEFYTLCSAASPCQLLVQEQAGSEPIAITPGSPSIGALADGAFVLYDPGYAGPEPLVESTSVDIRTVLYGVGGLAIAGLALGGGGGGDDGPTAVSGTGQSPAADAPLKLTSSPFVNSRTPMLSGEGQPGSRVLVRIDTDSDGSANVTYAVIVGNDFRWTIDLATAAPDSGALPIGGLPDVSTVGITSTSPDGNVSLPAFQLAFDGTPPAPAVIQAVATDNVVNAAEKQAGVTVFGTAEAGGSVLVSWATQSATAAVNAAGEWQTVFNAAALPADGDYAVSAIARDRAGNSAAATQANVSVDTMPPALIVASVAGGDNQVAIADAGRVEFAGSSDPGARVNLLWNNLNRVATAGSFGQWSIVFAEGEVPASAGANFGYSITAINAIGNVATAAGEVLVDRQAPGAPLIGTVEGNNIVTPAERADGVTISGTSEAGVRVDVAWGNTAKPVTAGADGDWAVDFSAAEVPSVGSPGANTRITASGTDTVGNAGASASSIIYIQQPFPPPTIAVIAGNDVVSLAERNAGIIISGSASAGVLGVTVTWGGFSGTAAVSGGAWRITVPAGQVPADGNSTVIASIAGSPGVSQFRQVTIDTTPPTPPAIAPVEGDNRISVAERADGVPVFGTAEPGARVNVRWNGLDKTATAGANGVWAVNYAPGEVPAVGPGGGNTTITATAVDAVGNASAAAQRAVFVEQPFRAPTVNVVEGNDVVNLAERSDGVLLSGTVQAGAPGVTVNWGGFSGAATVSGSNWSLAVSAAQVPGDGVAAVVATIAGVGGGAAAQRAVTIDTLGPPQPIAAAVTGNDSISPLERFAVTVSGTSEANATVTVALGSGIRTTTADASGSWTTTPFTTFDLPTGPALVTLTAVATDRAGNRGAVLSRPITIEESPFAIAPQTLAASDVSAGIAGYADPMRAGSIDAMLGLDDPVRQLA